MATGYIWGGDSSDLTSYLEPGQGSLGFDLVILADLLFNHSEHAKLLQSIRRTLKRSKDAQALVFFTPYRPWLLQKDLAFFDLVRDDGFVVEKILEKQMDKVMFEEDPGVSIHTQCARRTCPDLVNCRMRPFGGLYSDIEFDGETLPSRMPDGSRPFWIGSRRLFDRTLMMHFVH